MTFSNWQIDRLRRALIHYCEIKGSNGRVLPWKTVEVRIATCPGIPAAKLSEDLLAEKLRRFAKRTELPSAGKLEQIKIFLLHERLLTTDALEAEPNGLREMIAARQYLASDTKEAEQKFSAWDENFLAVRNLNDGALEETKMRLLRQNAGGYFYVEDQLKEFIGQPARARPVYKKDEARFTRTITGYGFLATDLNLMYIFLRGASAPSRINYIEIPGDNPGYGMVLLRSGTASPAPVAEVTAEQREYLKYNLVGFLSLGASSPDMQAAGSV